MTLFKFGFLAFTLFDLVDIIIVASIIFVMISWLKGTRSVQMLMALLLLAVVAIVAEWGNLHGLSWVMSNIKTIGLLAFFIVFQPEIRGALSKLGQLGIGDLLFKKQKDLIPVDKIVDSAFELSKRNLGGLMIIARKDGLREVLESGTVLNAAVSPELIATLFAKGTPLHDGAVVIIGDQLVAAACELPLLKNPDLNERAHGMRHRAALGIASESDAIAVVVSEETGQVTIACGKDFIKGLSKKELKNKIEFYLNHASLIKL